MDWQAIFMGKESTDFLYEIALRSFVMFLLLFVGLRLTGKRGMKQLSVFELILIISLGSAAGDPMIYKEVGIMYAVVVFALIFIVYKVITYFITHFEKLERMLEGKPYYVIRDGKATEESLKHKELAVDEFFGALRNQQILHLGQIEAAVAETNGEISILKYRPGDVKPGLPVWPHLLMHKMHLIDTDGTYACACCGYVQQMVSGEKGSCPYCMKCEEWVKTEQ
jgi:uncharacterized membrane protein YcaP (DUF421 family)